MPPVTVYHYDAFSRIPNKGNPAGVVLDADRLTEEQMQDAAARVGFNETVFVMGSERATLRLRYFTPGHEISLCGHATMASMHAMRTRGLLDGADSITIETQAGLLPIRFVSGSDGTLSIVMKQARPKFKPFLGNRRQLMSSLGLNEDDLHNELPIVYGSTGTWTLLVPIAGLDRFARMKPSNERFPAILTENPRSSVHPFCLGAHDPGARMHARHFSSPYSGTVEDPVTGTASGVMGAYALTYLEPERLSAQFTVEQGQEIGRDGRVSVIATRDPLNGEIDVEIQGTAVYVKDMIVLAAD